MRCWNPECESNDADEWCLVVIINQLEDHPDLLYLDDNEQEHQSESDILATWCNDCDRITFRWDWVAKVLAFVKPNHQGKEAIVLPKPEGAS